MHSHDDAALLEVPELSFKLRQGCTSVVVGNCGFGLAPLTGEAEPPGNASLFGPARRRFPSLAEYRAALIDATPAVNVATLVGHHNLLASVLGGEERSPTSAERAAPGPRRHRARAHRAGVPSHARLSLRRAAGRRLVPEVG